MNAAEEAAFEASIYHYFLFKAGQAARHAAAQPNTAAAPAPSPAAPNDNDKEEEKNSNEDDGNKKPAAKPSEPTNENENPETPAASHNNQSEAPPATGQPTAFAPPPPAGQPTAPPATTNQGRTAPFPPVPMPGYVAPPGFPPMGPPQPPVVPFAGMMPPPPGQTPAGVFAHYPSVPPPVLHAPTQPLPASVMAEKYRKVATVIAQEFPDHVSRGPPNAQWIAGEACMRYSVYPKIQHELNWLRYQQRQREIEESLTPRKRGRPRKKDVMPPLGTPIPALGPPPNKKAKKGTKYARIATRTDVPDDVKELVATVRKESAAEKRNMKQKIARLEAKVVLTKEQLKDQAKLPPPPRPPPMALKRPRPPKPEGPPPTFESRYKELDDFKRANNHARVPGRVPGLGRWVAELRRNYRIVKENPESLADEANAHLISAADLTKERMDKLDELGFEWDVAKKTLPWQARFEQMLEFKKETGHCNVPRHYKPIPALGEWVHRQREYYAKNEKVIQGERTDKLNAVGFMWRTGTRGLSFEQRLEQCRNFRRAHGHLKVPPPPDPAKKKKAQEKGEMLPEEEGLSEEDLNFRWWAFRQRDYYRLFQAGKKSPMDKKRAKQLDELGFDWEARGYAGATGRGKDYEEIYNERVQQLTRVKQLHGDCNDIRHIEKVFPEEEERKKLLSWMKNQRKYYRAWKNGKPNSLSTQRRQLLEALDFDFEPRKHYAPFGSRKQDAVEEAVELEGEESDEESRMRDYQYIHGYGGAVSM